MALIQNDVAKGTVQVFRPQTAGAVHTQRFTQKVPALAANDIIEIGILPAYARMTECKLLNLGAMGAATVSIGLMSGNPGETTNTDGSARTVDSTFFSGQALTAGVFDSTLTPTWILNDSVDYDRSIGVKVSAAVASGSGTITVLASFTQ